MQIKTDYRRKFDPCISPLTLRQSSWKLAMKSHIL